MSAECVVVVDPYSSGRFLLYELKARGFPIICVRSSLKLGSFFFHTYDTHKQYFELTLDFQEEFESNLCKLVQRLQSLPHNVAAVFGGSEPGVELAECLAEALSLPSANGTALLNARKDKAEMQEQLRRCGVPAAEQIKSSRLEELLEWSRTRNMWPLVAKPIKSSGSDGIFFCKEESDIIRAHELVVGAVNPNGIVNTEIALQECLLGDEYIVDTVSRNGKHLCVAVWVYKKRHGVAWNRSAVMSEGNRFLPASGEIQDTLVNYVFAVLDAVGLCFGPCHTEVILTQRGPILVEVNVRLHGLQGPRLIELATGMSEAALAIDACLDGKLFEQTYLPGPGRYLYPLLKHCFQLVLISPVEGYLTKAIEDVISEMKLPSVLEICSAVKEGDFVHQSCDLNTSPGSLLMVHESEEQILADIKRIRAAEDSGGLYRLSSERHQASPNTLPTSSRLVSDTAEEAQAKRLCLPGDALQVQGL